MFSRLKEAHERRFALDEELRFKATARRNKLLGLWVAEQLGKTGAEAEAYATEVIIADLAETGDQDVIRKVSADLQAHGVASSEAEIVRKLDEAMAQAVKELDPAS
jgi:hypothetical protein